MLNFNLSIKGLGLVSPPNFSYDFSRKIFHVIFHHISHDRVTPEL